jgi:hypothetical protein
MKVMQHVFGIVVVVVGALFGLFLIERLVDVGDRGSLSNVVKQAAAQDFSKQQTADDQSNADAALQELHTLGYYVAKYDRAAKQDDDYGCRSAYENIPKTAHDALEDMNRMSFTPVSAVDSVSTLFRLGNTVANGCDKQVAVGLQGLDFAVSQAIAGLRSDFAIGSGDWYGVNTDGAVEAKNPLKYAQSLKDAGYSWVSVRPFGAGIIGVPDWKKELASTKVDDPTIDDSGSNLKAAEVDYRKNSGDNNTVIPFYRTREEAQAQAQKVTAKSDATVEWYYKDDNKDGEECHKMIGTPQQFVMKMNGQDITWNTNDVLGAADVAVDFTVKGRDYSYSFFKGFAKCSNPFNAADDTKSDFSIDPKQNGAQDTPEQTQRDTEALAHAGDQGPWWVVDGTKTTAPCLRSKVTPLQDAQNAKSKGARNIRIHAEFSGIGDDTLVEYDLNGKSFSNDYSKKKGCGL